MAFGPDYGSGKIAEAIALLAGQMLTELMKPSDRGTVDDFVEMLTTSPIAGTAYDANVLQMLGLLGEYQHEDSKIQEFIWFNFEQMDGSLTLSFAELTTAKAIGWSASEIAIRDPKDARKIVRPGMSEKWLLESLTLIPQKLHTFEGKLGQIDHCKYYPIQGTDKLIPYDKVIHVINRRHLAALTDFQVYGIADCRLALAAHKAWKIIVAEALIAGQRQATPIIVGKAPKDGWVEILGPDGLTVVSRVNAVENMRNTLASLNANGGVISTDLESEIETLAQQTDGRFFLDMLDYLQRLIILAFMVPETLLQVGRGGLGNAGLAESHQAIMRLNLINLVDQIKEEMLEKLIRPLIEWNFGPQESYGTFTTPEENESQGIELLKVLNSAFGPGWLSTADLEAVNRARKLAGIPPAEEVAQSMLRRPRDYWRGEAA